MVGSIFYYTILYRIITHKGMVYFTYLVFLISGGFAGIFFRKHISIIMTAFIGSYLIVRSISFFIDDGK